MPIHLHTLGAPAAHETLSVVPNHLDHAGTPSWSRMPTQAEKRPRRNEYATHVLMTGKAPQTSSEVKTTATLNLTLGNPKRIALTPGKELQDRVATAIEKEGFQVLKTVIGATREGFE